jgi:DNA-binding SARP family transcriptional activator
LWAIFLRLSLDNSTHLEGHYPYCLDEVATPIKGDFLKALAGQDVVYYVGGNTPYSNPLMQPSGCHRANSAMIEIQLLGAFRLSQSGIDLPIKSTRQQALLAYLLLHASAPQPRYHVAFQLWPDASEPQARNSLRNLLSQIRQLLPEIDSYLKVDSTSLQWKPQLPYWCDVHEVDNSVTLAASATADERRLHLEHAIGHYTGELLPSCYDDWILPQRALLHRSYVTALADLVDLLEQQRSLRSAVRYATRLVEADPLDEAASD